LEIRLQKMQREQMALEIVQTQRESCFRGSMVLQIDGYLMSLVLTKNVQTQSEPDLRESQLAQERVIIQREFPLRSRWERDISQD
jgi:hypothetical protein